MNSEINLSRAFSFQEHSLDHADSSLPCAFFQIKQK